jgi:putative lipoprotein
MRRVVFTVVAAILFMAGDFWCGSTPAWPQRSREPKPGEPVLMGTVSARERLALPGMAKAHVELLDLSGRNPRDAKIGEDSVWITSGKLPVTFRIGYDPSKIDPTRAYGVRARILDGEELLMINMGPTHVLTRGSPRTIDVVVVPARRR